jgi:hypothetical protein
MVTGTPGPTGRYVICPWSETKHGVVAKQVELSDNGNLWCRCVCGVRIYAPKGHPLPNMTLEAAIQSGAAIPDEMM